MRNALNYAGFQAGWRFNILVWVFVLVAVLFYENLMNSAHGRALNIVRHDRTRAMATIEELRKLSPGGRVAPFNLALPYLGLGDRARALDYLEQAFAGSSELLVWLKIDRIYDPLRSEPRFIALMKRLNFAR